MHHSKLRAGLSKLKLNLLYVLIASCAGVAFLSLPGIFSNILPVVIPIILFQPPQIQVPTAVLPFNSNLQSAAITPDGSKVYVTGVSSGFGVVSVIDVSTNEVIPQIIKVGTRPSTITITPDGSKAYVTNSGTDAEPGNTVSVIDVEQSVIDPANAVIATVIVGTRPGVIAISPDGSRVYVGNLNSNTVSVIDVEKSVLDPSNAVIDTVSENVGPTPIGIAITGDNSKLYVANFGTSSSPAHTVSVIDIATNRVVTTVTVKPNPIAILIAPDNSRVYVANADTITVIDVPRDIVINKIFVRGGGPTSIAVTLDGSKVYLASSGRDRVSVIDVSVH